MNGIRMNKEHCLAVFQNLNDWLNQYLELEEKEQKRFEARGNGIYYSVDFDGTTAGYGDSRHFHEKMELSEKMSEYLGRNRILFTAKTAGQTALLISKVKESENNDFLFSVKNHLHLYTVAVVAEAVPVCRISYTNGTAEIRKEQTNGFLLTDMETGKTHIVPNCEIHDKVTANMVNDGTAFAEVYADTPALEESLKQLIIKKCRDCGKPFAISQKESEWYVGKGFSIPARCESCRKKRKTETK